MIEVMARTVSTGRTSMMQLVEIHGHNGRGLDDLRAVVEFVNVHVDLDSHRPVPLPEWVGPHFAAFDARLGELA
jgi:acyl-CoA thioester hydrolase